MKQFLLPPLSIFVLAALLALLRRYGIVPRRAPTILTLVVAYALCTPMLGESLLAVHQVHPPLTREDMNRKAGAVVVLGAGYRDAAPEFGGTRLDALSLERILYAKAVQGTTDLPLLVTGGRIRETEPPIGAVMRDFLRFRLNAEVRWTETRAENTWQNAKYSARVLRDAGIGRVYLVTHAWHMPRAVAAFEAHGLEIVPAPTGFVEISNLDARALLAGRQGLNASYYALHEVFGRFAYMFYDAL